MKWKQLLNKQRKNYVEITSYTEKTMKLSEFDIDYRRIIQSASFRRLQDKTQVFPLEKADFVRTRLTHSLEVAAIAEGIGHLVVDYYLSKETAGNFGDEIKEIPQVLKCAGLIHDLGNPPFGHFGESVIQNWFTTNLQILTYREKPIYHESKESWLTKVQAYDLMNFDGNAHTFRIVNRLHFDKGTSGLNLTYAVLSAIGKYTVASDEMKKNNAITSKKIGYFDSEREDIYHIAETVGTLRNDKSISRHPLSFIVEAADDIAYRLADLEDTFKKGLVTLDELIVFLDEKIIYYEPEYSRKNIDIDYDKNIVDTLREYRDAKECYHDDYDRINKWLFGVQIHLMNCAKFSFTYNSGEIMKGTYNHDLFYGTNHEILMDILRDFAIKYSFTDKSVNIIELSSVKILEFFLDSLVPVMIKYETSEKLNAKEEKLLRLISKNYLSNYELISTDNPRKDIYYKIQVAVDCIAGMTDSYARNLYMELNGMI